MRSFISRVALSTLLLGVGLTSTASASILDLSFSTTLQPGSTFVSATDLQATVGSNSVATNLTGEIDIGGTDYAVSLLGVGAYFGFNDNKLTSTAPYVDNGGLAFTADSIGFILYENNNGTATILSDDKNFSFPTGDVTLTVAAVPEPATWMMMILGFAGLGFLTYGQRSTKSKMALMGA